MSKYNKYQQRVGVTGFSDMVESTIDLYCKEIEKSVPNIVEQAAKKCLQSIRVHIALAGIKDKDYSKSWKAKCEIKSPFYTGYRVYSEKRYRIAHLLEHGHAKVSPSGKPLGTRADAFPHLQYAEQDSVQFMENMFMKTIEGGS